MLKFKRIWALVLFLLFYKTAFATIKIFPDKVFPGGTVAIYISTHEFSSGTASFLGQKIDLFPSGRGLRGLFAISLEQKAGRYKLELRLKNKDGIFSEVEKWIKIYPRNFATVHFWLKPSKKKLHRKDLIQEEWSKIESKLVVKNPQQYWRGKFSLPVSGRISMSFGTVEYINGKKSGQHRGLDLAVPEGTSVKAPAQGKVVFAQELKAFGKTVVLDHGQGVHSLYFHLSKILKEVGEGVEKGEVVGLSGNTGISSGPHLHWGISVNNVRVDPLVWTRFAF